MSPKLTDKQRQVLELIEAHFKAEGRMPSLRGLAQQLGVSLRAVQQHIIALKKKGTLQEAQPRTATFRMAESDRVDTHNVVAMEIPILGSIAAGAPSPTFDRTHQQLTFSPEFFGPASQVFALQISGNSMLGDQIRDGDWVIIERTQKLKSQDIVAVRVDQDEFTLKRIKRDGNDVQLVPSNSEFSIVTVSADRVEIVGKFVGLIRK